MDPDRFPHTEPFFRGLFLLAPKRRDLAALAMAIGWGFIAFFLIVLAAVACGKSALFLPLLLLSFPLAIAIVRFSGAPYNRIKEVYRYYSPTFFLFKLGEDHWDMHMGASYDYWAAFRWADRGEVARQKILLWTYDGILRVIDDVDTGVIPKSAKVTGTSYFFSERTAHRLGFSSKRVGSDAYMSFLMGVVDLPILYSFVKGRVAIPPLFSLRQLESTAGDLAQRRAQIELSRAALVRREARKG